jgi:carbonic anhydrase
MEQNGLWEALMHRRQALKLFASLAVCPLCAATGFAEEKQAVPQWSYEGATGPENWGSLDASNRMCSIGTQQSPIDLAGPVSARQPRLEIRWSKPAETIVNNGDTIRLNVPAGNSVTLGDRTYDMAQFHFHHPSEHLVDGMRFAMEAHFVHAAADGGLAVVGVLMSPGGANAVFNKIVSTMPIKEGPPVPADPAIDPNGLLPARRDYYRYEGSLTTPPCSETVDWLVLADRIEVSEPDIARVGVGAPRRHGHNRDRHSEDAGMEQAYTFHCPRRGKDMEAPMMKHVDALSPRSIR